MRKMLHRNSRGAATTEMGSKRRLRAEERYRNVPPLILHLSRFGAEDPSDGGNTSRFSLSGRIAKSYDAGSWKANAYVIKSELDLFNDFTYFLTNPKLGDQFHQHDQRIVTGANVARTFKASVGDLPVGTRIGIQTGYDAINLGLTDTYQRAFLSNIRSDKRARSLAQFAGDEGSDLAKMNHLVEAYPARRATGNQPFGQATRLAGNFTRSQSPT
jgi:hypothetical protein